MVGEPRRHGRRAGSPLRGCAGSVGALGLWQGLAYARVGHTEIVVTVEHGHLLPQAVFALTPGADPSPNRGDMLPDGEIEPLHKGCLDLPTQGASTCLMASREPNTTRRCPSTRRRRHTVFPTCA